MMTPAAIQVATQVATEEGRDRPPGGEATLGRSIQKPQQNTASLRKSKAALQRSIRSDFVRNSSSASRRTHRTKLRLDNASGTSAELNKLERRCFIEQFDDSMLASEWAALLATFAWRFAAIRQNVQRHDQAAALRTLLEERLGALRAFSVKRQQARAAWREAKRIASFRRRMPQQPKGRSNEKDSSGVHHSV